jgi:hypothetical protein
MLALIVLFTKFVEVVALVVRTPRKSGRRRSSMNRKRLNRTYLVVVLATVAVEVKVMGKE